MLKSRTFVLTTLAVLGTTALVSTNASADVQRFHAAASGGERLHAAAGAERLHAAVGGGERFHAAASGGQRLSAPLHEINHGGCGPEGCAAHADGSFGRLRLHPLCGVDCGEPHEHDHDDHDHDHDHGYDHGYDHDHGPIVWGGRHVSWYFGWHRAHWVEPVGVVATPGVAATAGISTSVSTAVSTGAVASAPAASTNCNCLTKQYLQDGSVLFKDICTKEAALATPDELKAQAQGTSMQAP